MNRQRRSRFEIRSAAGTIVLIALALAAVTVRAETKLDIRLSTASYVLTDFQSIPEQAIPDALLEDAAGIAIIPNVLKIGFGIGARYGRGVLVLRDEAGRWRSPAFITLGSGSFGWQIGAQSADLVLVFRDRDTLAEVASTKFTLGADASIAAGPLGRYTSAATDVRFDAAVYSYSRTRGLFAGVALDGAVVGIDHDNNARYYTEPGITLQAIAAIDPASAPASARELLGRLQAAVEPTPAGAGTDQPADTVQTEDAEPEVRTFGLGEQPLDEETD